MQQLNSLREQMNVEVSRQREVLETTNCRLRNEEAQKLTVEERLEKALHDLHEIKSEHMTVDLFSTHFIHSEAKDSTTLSIFASYFQRTESK